MAPLPACKGAISIITHPGSLVGNAVGDSQMSTLKENIAAYETMQDDLELDYFGKWGIFHNEELFGVYETSPDAAA